MQIANVYKKMNLRRSQNADQSINQPTSNQPTSQPTDLPPTQQPTTFPTN